MTTLGQAYVQIMPSAKGISGSIQKTIAPEATAAGKSAGSRIASSIASSMGRVGKTLTSAITVPALGAATAVGGLIGALGFKRLVGMDNAQAKLKGLGVEGKQLEIVMESVKGAVTGTTHTMADGADVAAGALAAGVKEGADLERYIKLVGDAAIGSNASMGEMAQIFNRVQGTGKLMGTELNMIEHRMPGFSQALAKHLGVAPEKLTEMVSAGKVSSKDFLDTMESFAGGMSEAYAGTWSGLKDNILANIGIIGEALLKGLFEDGKEGMAEFLEFLKSSDGLKQWATDTGEKLRAAFEKIIEVIKNVIQWWSGLSDGAKKFIGIITGVAIAIGPVLMAMSKIVTTIMNLIPFFRLLGTVIAAITSPIGLVVAAIIAAVALIYIYWEPIKEFFINLWESIKEIGLEIWENLKEGWANAVQVLTETWQSITEFFSNLWQSTLDVFSAAYEWINGITGGAFGQYVEIIQSYLMTAWEVVQAVWSYIKDTFSNFLDFIKALVTGDFQGMKDAMKNQMENSKNLLKNIWQAIKSNIGAKLMEILSNVIAKFIEIKNNIQNKITEAKNALVNRFTEMVTNAIRKATEIVNNVRNKFNEVKQNITNKINEAKTALVNKFTEMVTNVRNKAVEIVTTARQKFEEVKQAIRNKLTEAVRVVGEKISEMPGKVREKVGDMILAGIDLMKGLVDGIKNMGRAAIEAITGVVGGVVKKAKSLLKIKSPSRVFMEFGGFVSEGLADGIENESKQAIRSTEQLAKGIEDAFNSNLDIGTVKSIGGTTSVGIDGGADNTHKAMEEMLTVPLKPTVYKTNSLNGSGNNDVTQLLIELIEAVREGKNIVMDERVVGNILEPHITEVQDRNKKVRERFA